MTPRLILALVLLGASSDHFTIKEVTPGTPGAKAGLAVDDVIGSFSDTCAY